MSTNKWKILSRMLAISTFGFIVLPACAFENPVHPRSPEEIQQESDENNPGYKRERENLDQVDPDNAPHSEEDRKNWASKDK